MPTFFDVSALTPTGPDSFDVVISADWTIGGKPNGGYLLAMLGRAATTAGTHEHVLAASAHFLAAPNPGPARLQTELLRAGRSASQLRVRLVQDGRACVESLITTGQLSPASVPYWAAGVPPRGSDGFADCHRVPAQTPTGLPVLIMGEVDLRLEAALFDRFVTAAPSGSGELRGWLALPDGEAFDPISLLYAIDSFPPATFDIELTGWVPTLELTAYVRALPAPGPVQVLQKAQLIEDQRVDESCFVWDSTGRLVAQSTQLAGIRLG